MRKLSWWSGWVAFLSLMGHRAAWGCAVCATEPTDPQSIGMKKAIIGLLVITGGVLTAFASFFLVLWRRSRQAPPAPDLVLEYVDQLETEFRQEEVTL
jgi:hypothetical protein